MLSSSDSDSEVVIQLLSEGGGDGERSTWGSGIVSSTASGIVSSTASGLKLLDEWVAQSGFNACSSHKTLSLIDAIV